MKFITQLSLLVAVMLLAGCTTTQMPEQQINQTEQQTKLANYTDWKIAGKLAFKSKQEKFSANLNWSQQNTEFKLRLSSFIGTTLVEMQGHPGFARLEADGKQYTDTDPSRLIYRTSGWNIPVAKLSLWIKGQHEPNDQAKYDEYGLVQTLHPACRGCQHWQLNYSRYKNIDGVWLPHQVELLNLHEDDNRIKIRIHSWKNLSKTDPQ